MDGISGRHRGHVRGALAAVLLAGAAHAAWSQAFCASDGQPRPRALLERFVNADCEGCWKDGATPKAAATQAVLDWVLPGSRGDEAPLSAVAVPEAAQRLQALGLAAPSGRSAATARVQPVGGALRVAHGVALSGYVGVSIAFTPGRGTGPVRPLTAWLALVEALPQGTEGSPVPRNLVRNVLQLTWDGRDPLSRKEQRSWRESRVMSVAAGANPERLRVIGWVEDGRGRLVAAAQSRCRPPSP
ncbi:MAG: hypothetical protein JWQ72_3588 [Polaromonas sp.]|nr:hypothetical protein [Polaromonas sp.]